MMKKGIEISNNLIKTYNLNIKKYPGSLVFYYDFYKSEIPSLDNLKNFILNVVFKKNVHSDLILDYYYISRDPAGDRVTFKKLPLKNVLLIPTLIGESEKFQMEPLVFHKEDIPKKVNTIIDSYKFLCSQTDSRTFYSSLDNALEHRRIKALKLRMLFSVSK